LIFLLWLSFEAKSRKVKILGKVLLILSVIIVLASIALLFLPGNPIHEKFIELSTKSRPVNWEMAQKGFLERPLLGWGPENYTLVFTKFFNPCLFTPKCGGEIWFDRTHNIVFDTLVTTGVLGLLTYLGLFFSLFLVLGKKYLKEKSIGFWTFSIFIALPISYFIQNLTVFDMVTSLIMFSLILGFVGFLGNFKRKENNEKEYIPRHPWTKEPLCFIFCLSFFVFVIQPWRADHFIIEALMTQVPQERIDLYERVLTTSPLGKYQIREFFGQHSEGLIRGNIGKVSREDVEKELSFIITELEKTNKESPLEFRSVLKLANLYNLYSLVDSGKISLAQKYGERAIELSPANQQGYWTLAQTKIYQRDFESSLSLAQKAIDLEPNWLQSHKIAIQIAQMFGNTELTEELIENAIKVNSDWQSEFEQATTSQE